MAPSPLSGEGSAGATNDMISDIRSNTIAQAGTGRAGDGGQVVACMSTPKAKSKYLATGMPGMLGRTLARSFCKLFIESFALPKRSVSCHLGDAER